MNEAISRGASTPRKRDAEATRAAILQAAQAQFALAGYDHVALRDIAREAGADVALVKRYFGGKEGLFTEVLKATFRANRLQDWDPATFGRTVATLMADNIHVGDGVRRFQLLLRAATSPTTAPLLSVAMQERFFQPIADWLGGPDANARARVLAATFIGFLVERLVRDEPLEGRDREVFIERATAVFDTLAKDPL